MTYDHLHLPQCEIQCAECVWNELAVLRREIATNPQTFGTGLKLRWLTNLLYSQRVLRDPTEFPKEHELRKLMREIDFGTAEKLPKIAAILGVTVSPKDALGEEEQFVGTSSFGEDRPLGVPASCRCWLGRRRATTWGRSGTAFVIHPIKGMADISTVFEWCRRALASCDNSLGTVLVIETDALHVITGAHVDEPVRVTWLPSGKFTEDDPIPDEVRLIAAIAARGNLFKGPANGLRIFCTMMQRPSWPTLARILAPRIARQLIDSGIAGEAGVKRVESLIAEATQIVPPDHPEGISIGESEIVGRCLFALALHCPALASSFRSARMAIDAAHAELIESQLEQNCDGVANILKEVAHLAIQSPGRMRLLRTRQLASLPCRRVDVLGCAALEHQLRISRFKNLRHLRIAGANAKSFPRISPMKNLWRIDILNCEGALDLRFLTEMKGLRVLQIRNSRVISLAPVSDLAQLLHFDLDDLSAPLDEASDTRTEMQARGVSLSPILD